MVLDFAVSVLQKKILLYEYLCNKCIDFLTQKNPFCINSWRGTVADNNNCVMPFTAVKLVFFKIVAPWKSHNPCNPCHGASFISSLPIRVQSNVIMLVAMATIQLYNK